MYTIKREYPLNRVYVSDEHVLNSMFHARHYNKLYE